MCEVCPGRQVVDANLSYSSQCRASLKACISSCGLNGAGKLMVLQILYLFLMVQETSMLRFPLIPSP